jgi:hypothetical protein
MMKNKRLLTEESQAFHEENTKNQLRLAYSFVRFTDLPHQDFCCQQLSVI